MPITDANIPEGKLISSIHGGVKALELSIDKLKKFEFSGYILTKKEHTNSISEGYLILKDGVLIAAIYGRRENDKFIATNKGEEGLKLAWGDSYDRECTLEVHGRLDIEIILTQYPTSGINKAEKKKVVKRRTRFSLAWGDEEKQPATAEIDSVPEELRKKMEDWRSQGYVVKFLQEELQRGPENATMAFEQFENNVKRAEFLKNELELLDYMKFGNDAERIKAMLKNPSKITAIEAALQGLKLKIEQEKNKENELKMAELMAEKTSEPEPVPEVEEMTLSTQPEEIPIEKPEEDVEEKLAGQGDIFPPEKLTDNRCTICGADLYDKEECPTCGADNSIVSEEPQPLGEANLIQEFTFDSFVVGESNRFSHAAATAVSKPGTSAYNPLFICSGAGLGKTHLLNAIGNYVSVNFEEKKVLYVSTERFINEFIEATKSNKKKEFRKKYRDLDFLLLDDIHFIAGQEAVQDEFFHTFNALYKDGKQIVMTCDRPIREVGGLKDRLVSRFEAGLVTDMQPADVETRVAILKKKIEAKKLVIGDDVLLYIARRYRLNIRMLEGALNTLMAYSELMKVPITIETASLSLKDEPMDETEPEAELEPAVKMVDKLSSVEDKIDRLKTSHSYLIEEERPVKCFEYFVDNLNLGMKGLALTRINPKRVNEQYDVGDAQILWLTDKEGDADNRVMPVLERIIYKIEDFLNSPGKSILLIDGLDYLISNNNFDSVLRFLRRLIDEVSESDAIFITSVTPETIDEQGLKILEREMEIISFISSKI
ncbi:MAG: DnaA/Hda family protein [Thermoplasmata archaeon]|nr:DnaA/Hda family protein [Thermoplasmata archaeon]